MAQLNSHSDFDALVDKVGKATIGTVSQYLQPKPVVHSQMVIARSKLVGHRRGWIRAVVLPSTDCDDGVELPSSFADVDLLFTDLGITDFVNRDNIITHVTEEIRNYPHSVTSCRLAGIRPIDSSVGEGWGIESLRWFTKKVLFTTVRAELVYGNGENSSAGIAPVHLVLYPDPGASVDPNCCLSVNQLMVACCLAEFDPPTKHWVEQPTQNISVKVSNSKDSMGIGRGSRTQISDSKPDINSLSRRRLTPDIKNDEVTIGNNNRGNGLSPPEIGFLRPKTPAPLVGSSKQTVHSQKRLPLRRNISKEDLEIEEFIRQNGGEETQGFETRSDAKVVSNPANYFKSNRPSSAIDMNAENLFRDRGDSPKRTLQSAQHERRVTGHSPEVNLREGAYFPCTPTKTPSQRTELPNEHRCVDALNADGANETCSFSTLLSEYVVTIMSAHLTDDEIIYSLYEQISDNNSRCCREGHEPHGLTYCLDALMRVAIDARKEKKSNIDNESRMEQRAIGMICTFVPIEDCVKILVGLVRRQYEEFMIVDLATEKAAKQREDVRDDFIVARNIDSFCIVVAHVYLASRAWHERELFDGVVYEMFRAWIEELEMNEEGGATSQGRLSRNPELSATFLAVFLETVKETSIDVIYEYMPCVVEDLEKLIVSSKYNLSEKLKRRFLYLHLALRSTTVVQNSRLGEHAVVAEQSSLSESSDVEEDEPVSSSSNKMADVKYKTPNTSVDNSDIDIPLVPLSNHRSDVVVVKASDVNACVLEKLKADMRQQCENIALSTESSGDVSLGLFETATEDTDTPTEPDMNLFRFRHDNPADYPVPIAAHLLHPAKKAENDGKVSENNARRNAAFDDETRTLDAHNSPPTGLGKKKKKKRSTAMSVEDFLRTQRTEHLTVGAPGSRVVEFRNTNPSDFGKTQYCSTCGETTHLASDCEERHGRGNFY